MPAAFPSVRDKQADPKEMYDPLKAKPRLIDC